MAIIRADEVREGDTHAIWGKVRFLGRPDGRVIVTCEIYNGTFEPSDPVEIARRGWRGQRKRRREEEDRRLDGFRPEWRAGAPLAPVIRSAYEQEYGAVDG
jgi:hypothetical protein